MDEVQQQQPPQQQSAPPSHGPTISSSPTLFRQPSVQLYSVIKPKSAPVSSQAVTPGTPPPITNEVQSMQGTTFGAGISSSLFTRHH